MGLEQSQDGTKYGLSSPYVQYNPWEEKLLHTLLPKTEEVFFSGNSKYALRPEELQTLIMTNPQLIPDMDSILEYLISHSDNTEANADLLPILREKEIAKVIAKRRKARIEVPDVKEVKMSCSSEIIEMCLKGLYEYSTKKKGMSEEDLQDSIMTLRQDLMSYYAKYSCPIVGELESDFCEMAGCTSINFNGMASNGDFLFALSNDCILNIFPILENGSILPPFSRRLRMEDDATASIRFTDSALVVSSGSKALEFMFEDLINPKEEIVAPKNVKKQKNNSKSVSDGVTNLIIDTKFRLHFLGTGTKKLWSINLGAGDDEMYKDMMETLGCDMSSMCVETNGTSVIFYTRVSDTQYLCRQFSIFTGKHIGDISLELDQPLLSITLDIMNKCHWVATNNNGRIIIRAMPYVGVEDPFAFDMHVCDHSKGKGDMNMEVMRELSNVSMSSVCSAFQSYIMTFDDQSQISDMLTFIEELMNSVKNISPGSNRYITLQSIVIICVMNLRTAFKGKVDSGVMDRVKTLIDKFIAHSMLKGLAAFCILQLFGEIIEDSLIPRLSGLLFHYNPVLAKFFLRRLCKERDFYRIPVMKNWAHLANSKTLFTSHTSGLVFAHQRAVLQEVVEYIEANKFATASLERTDGMNPLNYLRNYAHSLTDEIVSLTAESFRDLVIHQILVFRLFTNFLLMTWGISEYHAVAQIIMPNLSLLPPVLSNLYEQKNITSTDLSSCLLLIGYTYGLLAATLITGGKEISDFETKLSWIVSPNMYLSRTSDVLSKLRDHSDETYEHEETRFIQEGRAVMAKIYKKWKAPVHARVKESLKTLDLYSFAALAKHCGVTFAQFETAEVTPQIRSLLVQMLRIRNSALAGEQHGFSSDPYLNKCKLLLKIKSEFKAEKDREKSIGDFIVGNYSAETFIDYLESQKTRNSVIAIGFTLLDDVYSGLLDQNEGLRDTIGLFDRSIAWSLSKVQDFRGIWGMFMSGDVDGNHPLYKFLGRVLSNVKHPLLLSAHKILNTNLIDTKFIGGPLLNFVQNLRKNPNDFKSFAMCYNRIGLIPDVLKVFPPFPSMTKMEWFLMKEALKIVQCPTQTFRDLIKFSTSCNEENIRVYSLVVQHAMMSISLPPRTLQATIRPLFDQLGKCFSEMKNIDVACGLVNALRYGLSKGDDKMSNAVRAIMKSVTPESPMSDICAVLAIAGGSMECINPYGIVSCYRTRGKLEKAVRIGSKMIILPLTPESVASDINKELFAEPVEEFLPTTFPEMEIIVSLFDRCTENLQLPCAALYIASLGTYLQVNEYAAALDKDDVTKIMTKLSNVMNPCDAIQATIARILSLTKKPVEYPFGNFGTYTSATGRKTYISPVIAKGAKMDVEINVASGTFTGYIGIVTDDMTQDIAYETVHLPTWNVYPSHTRLQKGFNVDATIKFRVDNEKGIVCFSQRSKMRFPRREGVYRLFVVAIGCELANITVGEPQAVFDLTLLPPIPTVGRVGYTPEAPLYTLPEWCEKDLEQAKVMLDSMQELPMFMPLVVNTMPLHPQYPQPPEGICLHFTGAVSLSQFLIDSAYAHLLRYLATQWATIVVMRLVQNGFVINSRTMIRLFSLLSVPLEPYSEQSMSAGEFPFSLERSVLDERAVINDLNMGMGLEAQQCLRNLSKMDDFEPMLEETILNMMSDPSLHLAMSPGLSLTYYPCGFVRSPMVFEKGESEAMIVCVPEFNNSFGHFIDLGEEKVHSFPLILTETTTADLTGNRLLSTSLSVLRVDRYRNDWVFGTIIELLLLLKQYSLMNQQRQVFVRSLLIDLLLLQSPFAYVFLKQFMVHFSQEFVPANKMTDEYCSRLLLFGSFINRHNNNIDNTFMTFFLQEKTAMSSSLPLLLDPYFPEFFEGKQDPEPSKRISIDVRPLDFKHELTDPLGDFLLYRSWVHKRSSIIGFPYWEAVGVWVQFDSIIARLRPPIVQIVGSNTFSIINECPALSVYVQLISNTSLANCTLTVRETTHEVHEYRADQRIVIDSASAMIELVGVTSQPLEDMKIIVDYQERKGDKVTFNTNSIRSRFINDINTFITKWNETNTRELLACFTQASLWQPEFAPLATSALSCTGLSNQFSKKVILLVTFLVHRFNYLWHAAKLKIDDTFWKTVIEYISSSETTEAFLNDIAVSNRDGINLTIDRHEAHRTSLEKISTSSWKKSIIYQFTSQIRFATPASLRSKERPWNVTFKSESAIDAGGPMREMFIELATSIFEPQSGLCVQCPNGRYNTGLFKDTFIPFSHIGRDCMNMYKAIGVFLGIIIRHGLPQALPFAPFVWKYLAGEPIGERDILMVDERLRVQFEKLRAASEDSDFVSRFGLRWVVEGWDGADVAIPSVSGTFVTGVSVEKYIQGAIHQRIQAIEPFLEKIKLGFNQNIGFEAHPLMTSLLLSSLCQGSDIVTTKQLKEITVFSKFSSADNGINHFWMAVDLMTNDQRCLLLRFITTLSRLPNRSANSGFRIHVAMMNDGDDTRLPCASTCFNRMYVPAYSTPEIAYSKICTAIELCQTMENV